MTHNSSEETGRHALTMDTNAWLVLPANVRPYRPLAVRPAVPEPSKPAPHPARVADASKVHAWPAANAATVPVPTPRPPAPTGFLTTVRPEPEWSRSKRIAVGIVIASAAVVLLVVVFLTAGPATIGGQ